MTLVQIYMIVALLTSFNVPADVISQVQEALYPPESSGIVLEVGLPLEDAISTTTPVITEE